MHASYDPERGVVSFLTNHFSRYAVGLRPAPFADVEPDIWYSDDVAFMAINGLMQGTGPAVFSPASGLSRGMAVTMLHRLAGQPASGEGTSFSDVAEGDWFAAAVRWAAQTGIAQGVGSGRFAPDQLITRQELAVLLARYLEQCGVTAPTGQSRPAFTDESAIADYAEQAVHTLCQLGVLQGAGDGSFQPLGTATRVQAAAIFHRLLASGAEF